MLRSIISLQVKDCNDEKGPGMEVGCTVACECAMAKINQFCRETCGLYCKDEDGIMNV